MEFHHIRTQYAVGQGGFHAASLRGEGATKGFLYVYDCGAMTVYATQRDREIDAYLSTLRGRKPDKRIDVIFISHLHADHVNGLPRLLAGARTDTVVLPLLNDVERLIAFAHTAVFDVAAAADPFFRDLTVDPSQTLHELGVRRVLSLHASPDDQRYEEPEEDHGPPSDGAEESGTIRWEIVDADGGRVDIQTEGELSDRCAVSVRSASFEWLLAPFVDPPVAKESAKFIKNLAKTLGVSERDLNGVLDDKTFLHYLVTRRIPDLQVAYKSLTNDLNISSLCLYSGPRLHTAATMKLWHLHIEQGSGTGTECVSYWPHRDQRVGWLGTGDAALRQRKRRDAFTTRYGKLLDHVRTMTLPHHGSDYNFHGDLLRKTGATLCVAAADAYSTWEHPGTETVQSVYSAGAKLHVATSSERSRLQEDVWMRC